jgi:TMEM175 potassium channel family protein
MGRPPATRSHYNQVAGQSLDRLAGLSDGIFAFAMTLLVLGLAVPGLAGISSESDLLNALVRLGPSVLTYTMSFLTLGIFWVGQQAQVGQLARSNRHYAWLQLALLASVTLIPFSTALLARFITYRVALV